MIKLYSILVFLIASTPGITQDPELIIPDEPEPEEQVEPVYDFVEQPAEFPGGAAEMMKFVQKNIRYPEEAAEMHIEGRVYLKFVIKKDGTMEDITVIRGVHELLDKEAIRILKIMPKWSPGKQAGKPVNTRFTIPIIFRLSK